MTPQEISNPTTSFNQINTDDTSNDASEIGTSSDLTISEQPPKSSTFDYLYEFSETRKVLEEFFKCPGNDEKVPENGSDVDSIVRFIGNIRDTEIEFWENFSFTGHSL